MLEPTRLKLSRALGVVPTRPAVLLAGLTALGVALHEQIRPLDQRSLLLLGSLILLSLILFRFAWLCTALLGLSVVLAGAEIARLDHFHYQPDHISAFTTDDPRLAQIEMEITQSPRLLSTFGQFRSLPPKQVTQARVLRVKTWNGWVDSSGDVLVQIEQPHPRLDIGQTVRVIGLLQRPGGALNPGQFDWADYYRRQRILASVNIAKAGHIEILHSRANGPITWLREKTRRMLASGFTLDQSLDHALMRALLLGDSDPELRDIQEQFRQTGTSHHLSISGLHIAVLGGFVYFLCRLLHLAPRTSTWIGLIFVTLYGIVALPSPPVVRSVLLCLGFGIGILKYRSTDPLNLLAMTMTVMLLWHPLDLGNAGFQLSFGTVAGMIILTPLINRGFANPEEQVIAQQHNLRGWIRRRWLGLRLILLAGLIAWLVSMPLIAWHFEQFNPWAIPAGIVLAPVVFVALVSGLLKVVLSFLLPGFAAWWALLALLPMQAMRWMVQMLSRWPVGDIPLPAPAIHIVLGYYLLLILPFLPWRGLMLRRLTRLAPVLGIMLILLLPLWNGWTAYRDLSRQLRVTLLAIGAGQACVIEPPGAPATIVDCGSVSLGNDVLRKCLSPYLRHSGRWSINRIILSHGDYDHISSTLETLLAYDVAEVLSTPHFRRHAADNPPAELLLESLDRLDRSPKQVARNDRLDLGAGAKAQILWPQIDSPFNGNNCGMVMKISYAGRTILLPADIQDPAMRALLADPAQLKSDALVAPHHGSFEITTPAFLRAINPELIASSNDRTLSQKQRMFDKLVEGKPFYRTHRYGAVTIVIRSDGKLWVETHLHPR